MTTVFISYSSRDRADLDGLLSALRRADEKVWFDDELGGGDVWWQKILERIRECEVFVFALSHNSLDSKPCLTELRYAQALQKPILPVQIGRVESMRVSPLAAVEAIDFRNPTVDSGIRLVTAVQRARERCGPLPSPLPAEPPVPYAYLMHLANRVTGTALDAQQQSAILEELKAAADQDGDDTAARGDIAQLLRELSERADATEQTRTETRRVLSALGAPSGSPAVAHTAGTQRISRRRLVAAAVAVVLAAGGGAAIVATRHQPQPATASVTVEPENVGAVLLTPAEITTTTGIADVTGDPPDDNMFVPSEQLSDPDCLGADYAAAQQVYEGSGWSAVSVQSLSESTPNDPDTTLFWVNQAAVAFPSGQHAVDFVEKSANHWSGCSGKVVKETSTDGPTSWTFGDLKRDNGSISQISFAEGGHGWSCEHALKAGSNVVLEAVVCGLHVKEQASRVVDAMVEKAKA